VIVIYADTSIWNVLCDQDVEPTHLCSRLADRGAVLALGFNAFYEIAKLFFSNQQGSLERGRKLLAYMKKFLTLELPMLKENCILLVEEAMHVIGQQRMESCFRNVEQYKLAVTETDKLIAGEIGPDVKQFFDSRKASARRSRDDMKQKLAIQADVAETLCKVMPEQLPDFLDRACIAPLGQSLLVGHLAKEFPKNSRSELSDTSKRLLESRASRLSRTMTRADLYLIWRCAQRGSLRADLPDDTFHVVNAAYSDVFLTTESDQTEVARLVIEGVKPILLSQSDDVFARLLSELG
jgi:hypothetical protein